MGRPKKIQAVEKKSAGENDLAGIVQAVHRVQAVIEFNLDGTIVTANENFLNCVGYTLEEIKGKHHRMFADPAYAASPEYQAFWAKLNRGEFDAGVYRRLGKGGKEIWIQASYNPIMDANGKPYKVVKFATDITEQKNKAAEFEGKIASVSKAQAVIEFNLDGTIITANENFLNCVGYTLDEIKGKHHRMFAEPAYAATGEYAAFWQKLNRGEFDAGAYRRLGKGGKEIWIQASYNPIMDANGKPYKVVKFAVDITGQKRAQNEVEKLIKAAAAGQLSERIKTQEFTGASKELTESFNRLLDSVATPLHEAQAVLTALATNDLTKTMTGAYEGEFEQMKNSLNSAIGNLTTTVSTVRDAVDAVSAGSEQITKGNEDLAQRTSEQASALEETSASMEEMTSTVKQNADNAKQANQLAIAARDIADKGGSVTTRAVEAMGEINKSSKKIADIITVIDEIAFQTNLLALNAAVEAARAGEHGRGFAVVAAEVRNLAQRSATAAKEIKGLINESIQRVNDGSELVDQSGKTLGEIVNSVKRVTDIIAEITAASQEQASGIDQVNKAIMQMDETTQQNAALVEETTSASQSMKEQAKELMRQVEVFRVQGSGGSSHPKPSAATSHTASYSAPKPLLKKPLGAAKPAASKEPVGVGASNGKDRRKKEEEFEEF
jgi:methyl-accepting chemotaxis protein